MIPRAVWLPLVAVVLSCAPAPGTADPPVAPTAGSTAGRTIAARRFDAVPPTPAGTPSWAPWPAALHDARHSGASDAAGPTVGRVRWHRRLDAGLTEGAVVGPAGTVYVASNDGVLHALDSATGVDRWTADSGHAGGGDLSTSPLVLPDGVVLWGTGTRLVALSPSGAQLWAEPLPGRPTSPASADGRRVYVGDRDGVLTAFDVGPGVHRRAWTLPIGSSSYGSVVTTGTGPRRGTRRE